MKLRKEFKNVICFLLIISFIISQIPSSVYAFNLRNSNKNEYNSLNALNDGDILESEGTYRVSDTYIIPSIIKKALNSYSSNYDDDYDYYDYLGGALGISGLKENSHIYNNLKNIYGLIKNKDTFVGDFLHICYLNSNKDIYITEKDENGYFNITLDKTDSNFFVDSIKIDYETYTDSENNIIYGLKLTLDEIKKDAQFKNEIKIGDTFNGGDTVYYIWAEGTNSKIAKFDGFAGMFKTDRKSVV